MREILGHKDLEDCRRKYGAPGLRRIPLLSHLCYLNIQKPDWCNAEDKLWRLFKHQWSIFGTGNIVWAHIVQANTLLFEPGDDDCPASVLFCPDPKIRVDLMALSEASRQMFQLKNTTPNDAEMLAIANALTDERTRTFGVKVPERFCRGFDFYEASTFVSRKHLPNGILSGPVFPLLVRSTPPYYCVPLPSRYWSQTLMNYWIQGA